MLKGHDDKFSALFLEQGSYNGFIQCLLKKRGFNVIGFVNIVRVRHADNRGAW